VLDQDRLERFLTVLTEITDGIEAGMFLARPGEYNSFFGTHDGCAYCDFDRVCPRARGDQWAAKTAGVLDHPGPLARYVALAGGVA